MSSLRSVVAGIASNDRLGPLLASTGIGRGLVQRVAGGEAPGDAMASIHDLADSGRFVSLERHWGAASFADLDSVVADYESIIELLGAAGIGSIAEINVPSAFLTVPRGPEALNEVCAIVLAGKQNGCVILGGGSPKNFSRASIRTTPKSKPHGMKNFVGVSTRSSAAMSS